MKPHVGQIVHYHPWTSRGIETRAAIIVGIQKDGSTNLVEFDFYGVMTMQSYVPLVQGYDLVPAGGNYATFPHQPRDGTEHPYVDHSANTQL